MVGELEKHQSIVNILRIASLKIVITAGFSLNLQISKTFCSLLNLKDVELQCLGSLNNLLMLMLQ